MNEHPGVEITTAKKIKNIFRDSGNKCNSNNLHETVAHFQLPKLHKNSLNFDKI